LPARVRAGRRGLPGRGRAAPICRRSRSAAPPGGTNLQAVGTSGSGGILYLGESLDIAHQLPDGPPRQHGAPRRHAVWATMEYGKVDLRRLATIYPGIVAQRRSHAAAPQRRVAAATVECGEVALSRRDGFRIAAQGIEDGRVDA